MDARMGAGNEVSNAAPQTTTPPSAAPRGGGGPGSFATRSPADRSVVTPDSHVDRGVASPAKVAAASAGARKPPPKTRPRVIVVRQRKDPAFDVLIKVKVVADGKNAGLTAGTAKTRYDATGVKSETPGTRIRAGNDGDTVFKIVGTVTVKGTVVVQTRYGPGAKATDDSKYGRGTTAQDKLDGNVTLGFHESCHQQDFITYLQTKPLPAFGGRVGQSPEEYTAAAEDFLAAMDEYFEAIETESEKSTDEVGYPKTQCVRDGKC